MERRVFTVFGGSGFLGRHLIQQLAATGAHVRVACRDIEAAQFVKVLGDTGQIVPWPADITKPDQVAAAVGKQIKAAIQKKNPAVGKKVLDVVYEVARETFAGLTPQLAEYTAGFMVRNFTAQELAALVAFYKTPAGQKSVTVIPKMTQEMMVWIGPVTRDLQADMLSRLKARFEEFGSFDGSSNTATPSYRTRTNNASQDSARNQGGVPWAMQSSALIAEDALHCPRPVSRATDSQSR